MAENQTVSAIDDESKSMLEEHVKKGKPRKFILICKGASVETLIVFKKGPYGPKIAQAKKAGFRGTAYCGVITGKGVNVELQLPGNAAVSQAMGTEGSLCEGEPCKVAKLREFFVEAADLKLKPVFSIVTAVDRIVSVSEEDDHAIGDTTGVTSPAGSTTTDEAAEAKQKLTDAMRKLLPTVQEAVKAHPARKDEILARANQFNSYLKNDDLDAARQVLLEFVPFLKQIRGLSASVGDGAADVDARIARLGPKLKQILTEKLGDFAQIGALFKQARESRASNHRQALDLLEKCEQLVEKALEVRPKSPSADAGFFDKGLWQAAKQAWLEAVETVDNQIAKLQSALLRSNDDELVMIANFGLNAVTGNLKVPLMAAMRDVDGGEGEARLKSIEKLRSLAAQFKTHLASDERVAAIDENDFGVAVTIRQTLGQTLDKMHSALSRN